MYTLRKYHSLLFTYQRIAPEYREAFVCHMGEEMGRLLSGGEYSRGAFTSYEWRKLNLIVSSPLDYHKICTLECNHLCIARGLERITKHKRASAFIRKADRLMNKVEIAWAWSRYEGIIKTVRRIKWKNMKDLVPKEEAHG